MAEKRSISEHTEDLNREVVYDVVGTRNIGDVTMQDNYNGAQVVERNEPMESVTNPSHLERGIRNQENSGLDQKDDDIQITESNMTNPLTSFPHPRHVCGVYSFVKDVNHFAVDSDKANTNSQACDNCYCILCALSAMSVMD